MAAVAPTATAATSATATMGPAPKEGESDEASAADTVKAGVDAWGVLYMDGVPEAVADGDTDADWELDGVTDGDTDADWELDGVTDDDTDADWDGEPEVVIDGVPE